MTDEVVQVARDAQPLLGDRVLARRIEPTALAADQHRRQHHDDRDQRQQRRSIRPRPGKLTGDDQRTGHSRRGESVEHRPATLGHAVAAKDNARDQVPV